jgi:hypothetical protein
MLARCEQLSNAIAACSVAVVAALKVCATIADCDIPGYVKAFFDTHVMYHGTQEPCIKSIDLAGLRESANGMLGRGLYATHDIEKAKSYMGAKGGCLYKVEFTSGNVKVTDWKDTLWRGEGYDAIHTTAKAPGRPNRFPEGCINLNRVSVKQSVATQSLSERARIKLDEFFLTHPKFANTTIYVCGAMRIFAAAKKGASYDATFGGIIAGLITFAVLPSGRSRL